MSKLFLSNYESFTEFTDEVSVVCENSPEFGKTYYIVDKNNNPLSLYYTDTKEFSEGLLAVKNENEKWGFINIQGEQVVDCTFDEVSDFKEGFARCRVGDKWCYINNKGRFVIQPKFDDATDFKNGFASVKQGNSYGAINRDMNLLKCSFISSIPIVFVNNVAKISMNGKFGFIDEKGNIVIPCIHTSVGSFENSDFVPVELKDGECGFAHKSVNNMDSTQGFVPYIPYQFTKAGAFNEGLACVRKKGESEDCFISLDGSVVLGSYTSAKDFGNGLAPVLNKTWGYIDKSGKVVVDYKYFAATPFVNGYASVYLKEGENTKCGVINAQGKEITPIIYNQIRPFVNGYAAVERDSLWGFIDTTGKEVIPCKYIEVSDFDEGFAIVQTANSGNDINDRRYIDPQNNIYTHKQRNLIKALLYQMAILKESNAPESEIQELRADYGMQMKELKLNEDNSQNEGMEIPTIVKSTHSNGLSQEASIDELEEWRNSI